MVWSAVVTHQAVMLRVGVWMCVFAYMQSDLCVQFCFHSFDELESNCPAPDSSSSVHGNLLQH